MYEMQIKLRCLKSESPDSPKFKGQEGKESRKGNEKV
jgi:hypothetical protein